MYFNNKLNVLNENNKIILLSNKKCIIITKIVFIFY